MTFPCRIFLLATLALVACQKPGEENSASSSSSSSSSSSGSSSAGASSSGTSSGGGASSALPASSGGVFVPGGTEPRCAVVSINNAAPGAGPVHVGDVVELATPAGVAAPVAWTTLRAPYGSRTRLVRESIDGNVFLRASDSRVGGVDAPGLYVFQAATSVDGGSAGGVACSLTVVPGAGLFVLANWENDVDVDVHLMRMDNMGRFCDADATAASNTPAVQVSASCGDGDRNSCHSSNCFTQPLNWDATPGRSAGDPVVLRDGRNTEILQLPMPGEGDYLVGLGRFGQATMAMPTVRVQVFLNGWLRGAYTSPVNDSGAVLPVALVHVPSGGEPCVSDAREAAAVSSCAGAPCTTAPCTQCSDDAACGPATRCNTATQLCQGLAYQPCSSVGGCGTSSCVTAWGECGVSICATCGSGFTCDPAVLACTPDEPAPCTEADEPNNTLATALPFNQSTVPATLDSTLCLNDEDVASFQAASAGLFHVQLTPVGGTATSITVSIHQAGTQLASGPFGATAHIQAGVVEVRVVHGATTAGRSGYHLEAQLHDFPACGAGAGEPNNTVATAAALASGVSQAGLLCASNAEDFWRVTQPAGERLVASVSKPGNWSGIPVVNLLDDQGGVLVGGTSVVANLPATNTDRAVIVRVFGHNGATTDMPYTLLVETAPPPTCSEATEPNDTAATATPLPSATYRGVSCTVDDLDFYSITTNAAGPIRVSLSGIAGMNISASVLFANGSRASQTTTGLDPVVVTTTSVPAGPYLVKVQAAYNVAFPAAYTLSVTAPGVEPTPPGSSSAGGSSSASGPSSAPAPSSGGPSSASN